MLTDVNNADQDRTVNFDATGPKNWQVTIKPSYQSTQVSSISLQANANQSIEVEVTVPKTAPTGQYPVVVKASAGRDTTQLPLSVVILGQPSLGLNTTSGQLNTPASVDSPSKLTLDVKNTGTEPLQNVSLTASTPDGWQVTFAHNAIANLLANQDTQVTATITPGKQALAGDFTAVDHLNFELLEGEISGLLGPNGTGETTTIPMLMGLTEPSEGSVRVLEFDSVRQPIQVKRRVGYLPEHVALYDDLSTRKNLMYTADLNGLSYREAKPHVEWALERVGLAEVASKKVAQFSHGMCQRLGNADVLIKKARPVILDEPTLGIDPEAVSQLLDLILAILQEEHLTVLLSSHQQSQVQSISSPIPLSSLL